MWWVPLAAAAASAVGSMISNERNIEAAEDNRDFQERLSGTAHQREVADLRAAGLNPILSAFGKGASTPSGSVPTITDPIGPAVSTAMAARQMQADLEVKDASARKTNAEAELAELDVKARKPLSEGDFGGTGLSVESTERFFRAVGVRDVGKQEGERLRQEIVRSDIAEKHGLNTALEIFRELISRQKMQEGSAYQSRQHGRIYGIEADISQAGWNAAIRNFRHMERAVEAGESVSSAVRNVIPSPRINIYQRRP